jgi:hypothetical protein
MIPYQVKFLINENKQEQTISFQTNEKPVKGEIYTIEQAGHNKTEVKITEVIKVIIKNDALTAFIEYQCKTEKHEEATAVIGFGKRN